MSAERPSVRYYSEREFPLGPPPDSPYETRDGVVYQKLRDDRMWVSVEWAERKGIAVPDNWRDLA